MIPDEVLEQVRAEADIVTIVGEFVKLKRVGTSFRGPCPFHQGKKDNFSVSPRGGYTCFVCGEKGDVFTFVQKRLGLDFVESVKWVGAKAGVDVREVTRRSDEPDRREPLWEVNAAAAEFFTRRLWDETDADGARAREYLGSRGIDRAAADRFGLGVAPRDGALLRAHLQGVGYDDARQLAAGLLMQREGESALRGRFRGRLIFPIFDVSGHVVGFGGRVLGDGEPKYLNSAESDVFSKRKLLYALNWAKPAIRRAGRMLIVEGYFDVIRMMLAGTEEVVAPLGTALTEEQAELIRKLTPQVYLLYDSDAAGLRATFRAGDILLAAGLNVRVVTLPDGDDPDTFARKHGAAGIEKALDASLDVFDRKVQILERGGWFADLRRKREALDKMLPTIRVTADPILRDMYVSRASEAAGVSRELLERELAGRTKNPAAAGPAPDARRQGEPVRRDQRRQDYGTAGNRAEREIVRVLLHERHLVERVAEQIGPDSFEDGTAAAVYAALVADAEATVDELSATFDPEAIELLERLQAETGGLDDPQGILTGCINAIRARQIDADLLEIDRMLPLAPEQEKDAFIRRKETLREELVALGRARWKSFGQPRH